MFSQIGLVRGGLDGIRAISQEAEVIQRVDVLQGFMDNMTRLATSLFRQQAPPPHQPHAQVQQLPLAIVQVQPPIAPAQQLLHDPAKLQLHAPLQQAQQEEQEAPAQLMPQNPAQFHLQAPQQQAQEAPLPLAELDEDLGYLVNDHSLADLYDLLHQPEE